MLIQADARSIPIADKSVNCCVTSPPYWGLRDYGVAGQLGLERTPEEYIAQMVQVFREVKRVLRDDGTMWLNMGDTYAGGGRGGGAPGCKQRTNVGSLVEDTPCPDGYKRKDLVGVPWALAFALRADGWYLRSDIIWSKPNPMPESVTDRPTKAHEYIFLLSKSERYYYDAEAIKEESVSLDLRKPYAPGQVDSRGNGHDRGGGKLRKQDQTGNRTYTGFNARWRNKESGYVHGNLPGRDDGGASCNSPDQIVRNKRSVWEVPTQCFPEAHFATFPEDLIKPCILAGCPAGGTVLDPFVGSGTTVLVARELQCKGVGLELNAAYIEIAKRRLAQEVLAFAHSPQSTET